MSLNDITINITDIIFILIIIFSFFIGLYRGFVKEALALFGWFMSGWIAIKYYKSLTIHIREVIKPQIIADAISFGTIFIIIIIFTTLITHILSKNIQNSLLSPLDKIFGILFSLIRSLLIISFIFVILQKSIWSENTIPKWISSSYSYPIINKITILMVKFIPEKALSLNSDSLNLKNIINKQDLFNDQDINNVDSSDRSYTPSDSNQLNELNSNETIENNEN